MNQSAPLKNLFVAKRSAFSDAEVQGLLESLPGAAFLVDTSLHKVLLANAHSVELTAFTRLELAAIDPNALLLPSENDQTLTACLNKLPGRTHTLELLLTRRSAGRLQVQASVALLSPHRFLLTCTPSHLEKEKTAASNRRTQAWEAMRAFTLALPQPDLDVVLSIALQTAQKIAGASCSVIYQGAGEKPVFQRTNIAGSPGSLPENISPSEMAVLSHPVLWTQGKKALTGLHTQSRRSGFSYLASAPLGQSPALAGLLLIAGQQVDPPENLMEIAQTFAALVAYIIERQSLITQQSLTLHEQTTALQIKSTIMSTVEDGLLVLNADLNLLDMNPAAEQSLGYRAAEVYGQPVENILVGPAGLTPALADAQQGRRTETPLSIQLYRRNGQAFLGNLSIVPIIAEDSVQGIVCLLQDLSEQEEFKTQQQHLEQRALLGEFTASFAHELRNPINNISTGLQLLELTLPTDAPSQANIQRLQQDCDRLAELIKASLSIVRPMEYNLDAVDVQQMLQAILARWELRLQQAHVKPIIQTARGLPPIAGDQRALEQVFNNLIGNAIQAMGQAGGTLALKARLDPGPNAQPQVEISVSDTGPGIPPEVRDHIFEAFFTTKQSGTGLGLAIVKRIITAHKGAIQVTTIPGGTIFHIHLPAITTSRGEPT